MNTLLFSSPSEGRGEEDRRQAIACGVKRTAALDTCLQKAIIKNNKMH